MRRSPPSTSTLNGLCCAEARRASSRSYMSATRGLAWPGTMTQRCGSLTKPAGSWASRSAGTTRPLTWQMRVVMRTIAGQRKRSDTAKASRAMS